MIKRIALISLGLIASLAAMQGPANAQFSPAAAPQQQPDAAPAIPDDARLILLIRNAVIALNQANVTGNYTVLRDMGTANFQMTNSSARLAEVFATLRSRKLDLSPVMAFTPKLSAPPALQEGQVLRLTGFFPTSPEQVQFDLAFQHAGEQWQLAGIALNVAPPADGAQAANTSPASQLVQGVIEGIQSPARPGEAKPVRIDLSQPAAAPGKPAAPKKPAAVKKPKPPAPKAAAAAAPGSAPAAAPSAEPVPAPAPVQADKQAAEAKPAEKAPGFGAGWNPFAH